MSETWYPLALTAGGRGLFLLWASDGQGLDRVLANGGRVVSFAEEESARQYALGQHLALAPKQELHPHDLDSALRWLETDAAPDCGLLLGIWNLAGDVARGVNESFEDRGEVLDDVYDKLFLGSNLPSMTRPGERHQPEWTKEELGLLRATIKTAADLIRSRVLALGP